MAATEPERSLSIALMGAAGAIIAATLWGGVGVIPALSQPAKTATVIAIVVGLLVLVASIWSGGHGVAYGARSGSWNAFDLQAKFLAAGFLATLVAFVISAFSFGSLGSVSRAEFDSLKTSVDKISIQIDSLKTLSQANTSTIAASTSVISDLGLQIRLLQDSMKKTDASESQN